MRYVMTSSPRDHPEVAPLSCGGTPHDPSVPRVITKPHLGVRPEADRRDARFPGRVEQDVRRLEVAVDDLRLVRRGAAAARGGRAGGHNTGDVKHMRARPPRRGACVVGREAICVRAAPSLSRGLFFFSSLFFSRLACGGRAAATARAHRDAERGREAVRVHRAIARGCCRGVSLEAIRVRRAIARGYAAPSLSSETPRGSHSCHLRHRGRRDTPSAP